MGYRCAQPLSQRDEVSVCYKPYICNTNVPVHTGPSSGTPLVTFDGVGIVMPPGRHACRQSVNTERTDPRCQDDPPLRPLQNGFMWVYPHAPSPQRGGWINAGLTSPDFNWPGTCCGPAGFDVHCGRVGACTRPDTGAVNLPCDASAYGGTATGGTGPRTIDGQQVTLRYAIGGVAYYWLLFGDSVNELCRVNNLWSGVQVSASGTSNPGVYGWMETQYLA